jgi:hypothetical protein
MVEKIIDILMFTHLIHRNGGRETEELFLSRKNSEEETVHSDIILWFLCRN